MYVRTEAIIPQHQKKIEKGYAQKNAHGRFSFFFLAKIRFLVVDMHFYTCKNFGTKVLTGIAQVFLFDLNFLNFQKWWMGSNFSV